MSVKITLEFNGVDEAIVALGKLVVAPVKAAAKNPPAPAAVEIVGQSAAVAVAEKTEQPAAAEGPAPKTRKPRADKGQARGPYNKDAAGASASALIPSNPGSNAGPAVTDPSNGETPPTSTSTPAVAPVVAATSGEATNAPAAPVTDAQVMAAVEKIYGARGYDDTAAVLARFGAKKWAQLLPEQRGEFIAKIDRVLAGEAI
jgi:hypothetical protein